MVAPLVCIYFHFSTQNQRRYCDANEQCLRTKIVVFVKNSVTTNLSDDDDDDDDESMKYVRPYSGLER